MPIEFAEQIAGRIAAVVDIPVTVDFEGGYSEDDLELAANISRLLDLGVIGINFEDRIAGELGALQRRPASGPHLGHSESGAAEGSWFFSSTWVSTDVFFEHGEDAAKAVNKAFARARAYTAAGASGFFIPGLVDEVQIGRICEGVALPVNVMVMDGACHQTSRLAELGVSRISYGSIPYIRAMETLGQETVTTFTALPKARL